MCFFAYSMGSPQVSFFAYYMGPPLRSVSSHAIWGPPSGQFLRLLYGGPSQVSFFAYYIGGPLILISSLTIGGPLSSVSSLTIGGPLRSVSSHTIWGPPSDQFLRLRTGGPQFSFSLNFFLYLKKNYALSYPGGGPHIFLISRGDKCPLLPPPAGAHGHVRL